MCRVPVNKELTPDIFVAVVPEVQDLLTPQTIPVQLQPPFHMSHRLTFGTSSMSG